MTDTPASVPSVTPLRRLGYAVLPTPRHVELTGELVDVDGDWGFRAPGLDRSDLALRTFAEGLLAEHRLDLCPMSADGQVISLAVRDGAVATATGDERDEQAYRIAISPEAIEVVGNAPAGLFYGVQTLLQLLAGDGRRPLRIPAGTITDWPDVALRFLHWDTKHHRDRIETLKRYLDQMARLKLNAVSFELEDKFAYPSHPVIGAPGAFTPAEIQEVVDYALARHIQIVPNVQAPAHMCYVLKHAEFADLRCDGSNYQICMECPEARRLIFDMYDDLCDATEGVRYFHVSTDEVYYAGICQRSRTYDPVTRSLTWVDYVRAAHEHLAARGRRILVWAEFPLRAEHVELLPADIVNGILGPDVEAEFVHALDARGMENLAYASMQGEERLVPNCFDFVDHRGHRRAGRLADAVATCRRPSPHGGRVIGTFAAAWDDAGLHNETFWLGWATMAQGGWNAFGAEVAQTTAEFMDVHYGRGVTGMARAYRDLQEQARFWEGSWDRVPSRVRGPAYGNHLEKRPFPREDMVLPPPPIPSADGTFEPTYTGEKAPLVAEAERRLAESDRLLTTLHANIPRADRNRYGLEVFVCLARFMRAHLEMLVGLAGVERTLASRAPRTDGTPVPHAGRFRDAARQIEDLDAGVRAAYADLVAVWERSRLPRNAPVDGREFFHVMDDVKDHFADRRADLSFHLAPFDTLDLPARAAALQALADASEH